MFNNNPGKQSFTATGGQTDFDFNFKIYADVDLKVYLTPDGQDPNDTTDILTLTTDYTVVIDGDDGGTITLTSGATLNDTVVIARALDATRDISYVTNGDLKAATLNLDQDYQTYLIIDGYVALGNTIQLPQSAVGVDPILPSVVADAYIKWNSAGTALENDDTIPQAVIDAAASAAQAAASALEVTDKLHTVDTIAELLALDVNVHPNVNVLGYYVKGDGGGGIFYWDSASTETSDDGLIFGTGTGRWKRLIKSNILNVTMFGAKGDGTTEDTTAIVNAITAAAGKTLEFAKTDDYYYMSHGVAVYPDTTIKGNGATVKFLLKQNEDWQVGFVCSNGVTITDLKGYSSSNGFSTTIASPFICIGLFYGVDLSTRANYADIIPDITDASSPVGLWDAPQNVQIYNIECDISSEDTTHQYGASFIGLYNFIKNITITNIKGMGFAVYTDYATSWITTGNGIFNDNNVFDVIRFEWGHFVSPRSDGSGQNIVIDNVYGTGLRLHNHSAVISMGSAHQYNISNVVGESTGQLFHCSSSSAADVDDSVKRYVATNRKVTNVLGVDLYTWYSESHYSAAVMIMGEWIATSAVSPLNFLTIENVNVVGLYDATNPVTYPEVGICLGDSSWSGTDTRNVILKNVNASKFASGLSIFDCKNISIKNGSFSYNQKNGIAIASDTPYIARNIEIDNVYFFENNLGGYTDYTTNNGVGLSIFRADNVKVNNCVFGNTDTTAGTESQLHSVFLRNGQVGLVQFESCLFANYESASSFDIRTNNTAIKPIVKTCRSVTTTDEVPKVSNLRMGLDTAVVASGKFTAAPSTVTLTAQNNIASAAYSAAGRYTFTFATAMPDNSYYVMVTPSGATTPEFFPVNYHYNNGTASFELYVKDGAGNNVDPTIDCQFMVLYIKPLTSIL